MNKRVLIMAAGTGGHVFPGLAIAKVLKKEGIHVDWLGTSNGMEVSWVSAEAIPLHAVDIAGLRGKHFLRWLSAPFTLLRAFIQSRRTLLKVKPDLVLAMGGFVCGPGGMAAWWLGMPLVIHEQNAIAGLTNRILAKLHKASKVRALVGRQTTLKILEAFPNSFSKNTQTVFTGNPVREDLLQLVAPEQRLMGRKGPLKLLVLGGSRGAHAINVMVPQALSLLSIDKRPEIYHQTGKGHFETTQALYERHAIEGKLVEFIEDMPNAYQWADIVVCRSGAITLSELCCTGAGSILVPFPYAVDDHQTRNAEYLSKANAAILVQQSMLTPEGLAKHLIYFSEEPARLIQMAKNAYALRVEDATQSVVNHCRSLMGL
jgi:UDP-N-acetylglucosamine--N-acetylmuramyl-(pentapeptide) pyrophosphoryl-undecaprenol N-acetylglucosamine transferase